MTEPIAIDIWSDIACPWCYIGKRNLEKGLEALAKDDDAPEVDVTFHSYQLQPDAPVDYPGTHDEYLAEYVGMSAEQAAASARHIADLGAQAGLEYNFDRMKQTNTLLGHQLLHFAKSKGLQHEMKERLMAAHFTDGRHVGHIDDLVDLAVEVGLDASETREALESGRFADAVQQDVAQARAYGIQGVPFFVIDGQYGISGAQPAEAFENVLRDLWKQRGDEPASA